MSAPEREEEAVAEAGDEGTYEAEDFVATGSVVKVYNDQYDDKERVRVE